MNRGMERKAPIYGNLTILDPDGKPLFRCGERKFEWYVSKGLAVRVNDRSARLLFEPKGRGNQGNDYLMAQKDNVCVVCGCDEPLKLTRHHVVPHSYRTEFPPEYKDHSHYDILPMCRQCHDEYEHDHADRLKSELGRRYGAPLDGHTEVVNLDEQRASKYAHAILLHGERIPEGRQDAMLRVIEGFLGRMPSANDFLELAQRRVNTTRLNETHGEIVMSRVEDLAGFVKMWRKHFLDSMRPRFLPDQWDAERGPVKSG